MPGETIQSMKIQMHVLFVLKIPIISITSIAYSKCTRTVNIQPVNDTDTCQRTHPYSIQIYKAKTAPKTPKTTPIPAAFLPASLAGIWLADVDGPVAVFEVVPMPPVPMTVGALVGDGMVVVIGETVLVLTAVEVGVETVTVEVDWVVWTTVVVASPAVVADPVAAVA